MVVITIVTVVAMLLRFFALMYQPGSKVKEENDRFGEIER
jgi:hypothetical protein